MKKILITICAILLALTLTNNLTNKDNKETNCPILENSDYDLLDNIEYKNFEVDRNKYQLKKVVVLSRHNIRSPLSSSGTLNDVTNNDWFDWSSNASELSLKGGDLETKLGQYFRKYLVDNNLMEENYIPTNDEVRIYANSMQRTISTANYFSSGMFPIANIDVEYHMDIGTMDPVFFPALTFVSDSYAEQVRKEAKEKFDFKDLKDNYEKLEEVLDYEESNMKESLEHFNTNDTDLILELGNEPKASGSLNVANQAADALKLQFYEEDDPYVAAFNHDISINDWLDICEISDVYGEYLFTLPSVSINVAHPLLMEISKELNNENRIFTFLCGHDSNIGSFLSAMDVLDYSLPKTLERKTPIGSEIVFEVWQDTKTSKEYISVCIQYQSLSQLKKDTLLDLNNPPVKYHLSFKDVNENSDGLYLFDDFNLKLNQKINKYDEIVSKYN